MIAIPKSLWLLAALGLLVLPSRAAEPNPLRFVPAGNGEFTFDTGVLQGRLRPDGKSLGLASVTHCPTGLRLDRGNGLLSFYRVFTTNHRFGPGAWDWPSQARLRDDGAVEVQWSAATDHPFELKSVYRWHDASALDIETSVTARQDLPNFEAFVASYFNEAFTNAQVLVKSDSASGPTPKLLPAERTLGEWLMSPRDPAAAAMIKDGRWKLEPNPVDWILLREFSVPLGLRREPKSGLAVVLMAPTEDCFALAMPYQTESHYSCYLSLFGRTVKAGETATARARLLVVPKIIATELPALHRSYLDQLRSAAALSAPKTNARVLLTGVSLKKGISYVQPSTFEILAGASPASARDGWAE